MSPNCSTTVYLREPSSQWTVEPETFISSHGKVVARHDSLLMKHEENELL